MAHPNKNVEMIVNRENYFTIHGEMVSLVYNPTMSIIPSIGLYHLLRDDIFTGFISYKVRVKFACVREDCFLVNNPTEQINHLVHDKFLNISLQV